MIDKWFLEDIEHLITRRNHMVLLDPEVQVGFLLPLLESKGYTILQTDIGLTEEWETVKEELFLRQLAETELKDSNVVFYVTREQDKLSFLFDYCFTHGCLDLSNLSEWLKDKLFANTGLQIHLDNEMLLIAAKQGIGKDIAWWKKILQNLEEVISLDDELLPFLHDPDNYLNAKDKDIRKIVEEKLFELLGQSYMKKPPKTIAEEVVRQLLDGLAHNTVTPLFSQLYYRWIDSETYYPSFVQYVNTYKLEPKIDPWIAHPEHCFEALDLKALQQLNEHIKDKEYLSEKLDIIKARSNSTKIKRLVPSWWQDVIMLLEFDTSSLTTCNDFNAVVTFYADYYSKLDRAIRNLYVAFLQEKGVIRPLQDYYEALNYELLHKWFNESNGYQSNQQGYLVDLFKHAKPGIAVIVGDGIRYEIADYIAQTLSKNFKVDKQIMLADMPSETEHNMSALYVENGEVVSIHKDREKKLSDSTGKAIVFMDLEALNYGEKPDFLVLSYKDIDSSGEKLQQGAIKLFSEFEQVLMDKITQLLNMGYKEVHLVTDHGFVLTGVLEEADKISPDVTGKKEVHERYIRTVDKQNGNDWCEVKESYGEYNYVYAAKSARPFKSKGTYGFSHGGFTPQEIVLPKFCFRKEAAIASGLEIIIKNKKELSDVAGDIFEIKLQASSTITDLFATLRKVQLLIYAGSVNYISSNIITIKPGDLQSIEFSFQGKMEVKAVLLDAETREQLDVTDIKKSNSRDLGGLL